MAIRAKQDAWSPVLTLHRASSQPLRTDPRVSSGTVGTRQSFAASLGGATASRRGCYTKGPSEVVRSEVVNLIPPDRPLRATPSARSSTHQGGQPGASLSSRAVTCSAARPAPARSGKAGVAALPLARTRSNNPLPRRIGATAYAGSYLPVRSRVKCALQVARFSRERPQLLKTSIDLFADRVDQVRHDANVSPPTSIPRNRDGIRPEASPFGISSCDFFGNRLNVAAAVPVGFLDRN
jgi:hypothetical protein